MILSCPFFVYGKSEYCIPCANKNTHTYTQILNCFFFNWRCCSWKQISNLNSVCTFFRHSFNRRNEETQLLWIVLNAKIFLAKTQIYWLERMPDETANKKIDLPLLSFNPFHQTSIINSRYSFITKSTKSWKHNPEKYI